MLDKLIGHDLVADSKILAVEDLLEVAQHERLVGLGQADYIAPLHHASSADFW